MNGAELRQYELVYVLQPMLDEPSVQTFDARLREIISGQGGSDIVAEMWGKRNLAYRIGRFYEGYYILYHFQMPPTGTDEVDRALRFNENVIRYLLMREDD